MMTKIRLITAMLLVVMVCENLPAQDTLREKPRLRRLPQPLVFASLGFIGPPQHFHAGITFYHKSAFGGNFSAYYINLPEEYNLRENITLYSLNFMKTFPTDIQRIRIALGAGPSYIVFVDKYNIRPSFGGWFFGSSGYKSDERTIKTVGLNLLLILELPLTRPFGLEMGINGNINSARSTISIDIAFTFGKVRSKITK